MIFCPNCKEEIDDDSHYCDQCGQALLYCSRCGRVGLGRRCTNCGGEMISLDVLPATASIRSMPSLTLYNGSLNVRIMGENQAVIGRRNGPYAAVLGQFGYISSTHAQLRYHMDTGWCIVDLGSSNGTAIDGRPLQPDVEYPLNNGSIVSLANIDLQVSIQ